ncbi:unnamed protein product, partial [Chrysoparadoxa australica]
LEVGEVAGRGGVRCFGFDNTGCCAVCILTRDGFVHRIVLPKPAPQAAGPLSTLQPSLFSSLRTKGGRGAALEVEGLLGSLSHQLEEPIPQNSCCCWATRDTLLIGDEEGQIRVVTIHADPTHSEMTATMELMDDGSVLDKLRAAVKWKQGKAGVLALVGAESKVAGTLALSLSADWQLRVWSVNQRMCIMSKDMSPYLKGGADSAGGIGLGADLKLGGPEGAKAGPGNAFTAPLTDLNDQGRLLLSVSLQCQGAPATAYLLSVEVNSSATAAVSVLSAISSPPSSGPSAVLASLTIDQHGGTVWAHWQQDPDKTQTQPNGAN